MSQANLELMREVNASTNAGDWEALLSFFDPGAEWRDLAHASDAPEAVRGRDAIRTLVNQWTDVYEDFGADVREYIDADPWVICDARWYGRGRDSGVSIDLRQADAYELDSGLIVRAVLGYPDAQTALDAVTRTRP